MAARQSHPHAQGNITVRKPISNHYVQQTMLGPSKKKWTFYMHHSDPRETLTQPSHTPHHVQHSNVYQRILRDPSLLIFSSLLNSSLLGGNIYNEFVCSTRRQSGSCPLLYVWSGRSMVNRTCKIVSCLTLALHLTTNLSHTSNSLSN
jgi:hypothetical protein